MMTTCFKSAVATMCLMALVHGSVAAEDVGRPFKFSIGTSGLWTDNRDSEPDGMEEDNFDLRITPRLDFISRNERTAISLYYAPSYRHRTDPSATQNEDIFEHDLKLAFRHAITPKLSIRAYDKFDFNDDPKVEDGDTTRSDLSHIINTVDAGLTYEFSQRTSIDVAGVYRIKRYDDDEPTGIVDEDEATGTAILRQQFTEKVTGLVLGRYSMYEFDDAPGLLRNFDSALMALGVEAMLNSSLLAEVQGGWQMVEYEDDTLDSATEPYVLVGIGGSDEQARRLKLQLRHGIRDADAYPYASQEYSEVRIRFEWDAISALTFAAEGTYRVSTYDDAPAGTAVSTGDEDTIVGQLDVTYRLRDRLTITAAQRYEEVETELTLENDYVRNSTRIGATVSF